MIALAGKATSIRTRLYFATVFSLLLLVGVGLLGYVGLDRTRDTVAVLFKQHVQTLTDMSDLRTTLGEMRRVKRTSFSISTTPSKWLRNARSGPEHARQRDWLRCAP